MLPTYKYVGTVPFVSNLLGLRVYPGDTVYTPYALPSDWSDFVLLDINSPPALLPHTELITVDQVKRITADGYTAVVFILRNPEEAIVSIRCAHLQAPGVTLDSAAPFWRVESNSVVDSIDTFYLVPESGIPQVTVYYGFKSTEYGMFGVHVVSGGGGGTAPTTIGTPTDGTYEDGVLDFTPTTKISDAVDEINELLKYVVPEPPKPLAGTLQLSVAPKEGYIANYSNLGSLSPGQYHTLIVNTPVFSGTTQNTQRFSDADKGQLILLKNDTEVDSFDLAAHFNESEREGCQSYPPASSSGGKITVVQVCWYNNFPAYQKGQARVNFNNSWVDVGYNKVQLKHVVNSEERKTTPMIVYYDDGPAPTIDTFSVTLTTPQYKWLSGIKYYSAGTQWQVSIQVSDLFNKTYLAEPVTITGSGLVPKNIKWDDPNASGFSSPPNWNDGWQYSGTITINSADAGKDIDFQCVVKDPFGSTTAVQSYSNYLYNTYGVKSTDKHEYFVDEHYRLPPGDYDSVPDLITGNWDSTAPLTDGNAQVYLDRLVYPHENFSDGSHNPEQEEGRDYSTFSGDQLYFRAIRDSGTPHTSGELRIRGVTTSDIGSRLLIHIKLPGQTGWIDLSKPFVAASFTGADGDGGQISLTQEGNWVVLQWSTGVFSTANSGYLYVLRLTLKDSNVTVYELYDFGG